MSDPKVDLAEQAAQAGKYPQRFNKREQKLLESVKAYADQIDPDLVITTEGDLSIGDSDGAPVRLPIGAAGLPLVSDGTTADYDELTGDGIADDAVSKEHLDSGIDFSHRIFAAGQPTTAGGAAAEVITVAGVVGTDLVFAQMVDNGTNNTTIVSAAAGTGSITVTFSGDPGADAVINYQVLRAAT